jgi:superoxide dismutase, Fe-Mn family
MDEISRRSALGGLAVGAVGIAAASRMASAQEAPSMATAPPAFAGQHQPKPLRFNPASLEGLSERLIQSHWENNYGGSVRTLNMIETRLAAAVADPDFPPAAYGGLKREELLRTGSVVLHEIYFDGLGGNGEAAGGIREALATAFGSFDTWLTDFKRTASALGGGSGWVILALNTHTGGLHNYWSWDHMHAPAMSVPLLVLDMYEHSYQMDYGAAAARYIDAFFRNVDWEVVDQRLASARP